MPSENPEVSSTTQKVDAPAKSGNINIGQAAVQLLAAMQSKTEAKPVKTAQEVVTPAEEVPPETTETPTAEVPTTSEVTEPEAAPETTEVAATEPEADIVPSQHPFTAEQQELFNKRIGKEVAKTKAVEAKLKAEYEAKIAELQSKVVESPQTPQAPLVVNPNIPLSEISDIHSLGKLQQTAKEAIRYVEDVLEDPSQWRSITVPDPTGGEQQVKVHQIGDKVYTETDLKKQMRKAKVTLEDHIPARQAFLQTQATAQSEATKAFPFLSDKTTPEYQMVQAAKRNPANAAILTMPNADYVLGLLIEGETARKARIEAAKAKSLATPVKPKVVAKPPSDQTAVSASTAPTREPAGNRADQKRSQAIKDSLKKGNINPLDAAKLLR